MWQLSWPAIIAMMLFGLNAFMDTVYVGQLLNEVALGGVAIAYPLTSITMAFAGLAGTGAGNLISIALGQDDVETQNKILPNTTLMMLLSTLIFAVPSYLFAEELIALMGAKGEILNYGISYFKITVIGSPFWVYGLGMNLIVRGEGKMKKAAGMFIYGLVVNLILTPLFIQYFKMGVGGAAWATNVGMVIYSIIGFMYFKNGDVSFNSKASSLKFDKLVFSKILKLGFPGFILSIMSLVQAVVVFNALTNIGDEGDLAFFAAANRILFFLMTPLFGLMRALQPVVGVNYGAKQFDRVKSAFIIFCAAGVMMVTPFWIFMSLFPQFSLSLILPGVVFEETSLWYFRVYIFMLPFLPFVFMALTYLPAIEQPKYASIMGSARQLVFYVPVMLILPYYMGIKGIYYGTTAIDLIITVWMGLIVWIQTKKLLGQSKNLGQSVTA